MSPSIGLSLDFLISLAVSKLLINSPSHFQLAGNLGMSLPQATFFFMWERRLDGLHKIWPLGGFLSCHCLLGFLMQMTIKVPLDCTITKRRKVKVSLIKPGIFINYCLPSCKYMHLVTNARLRKWPESEPMFSLELDKNSIYHLEFLCNSGYSGIWGPWSHYSLNLQLTTFKISGYSTTSNVHRFVWERIGWIALA